MPRKHTGYRRNTYAFPADFPQRVERLKEESGLSQAGLSRCLGIYPHTVWSWTEGRVRPNGQHMVALPYLAEDLGPG